MRNDCVLRILLLFVLPLVVVGGGSQLLENTQFVKKETWMIAHDCHDARIRDGCMISGRYLVFTFIIIIY
jgi:hypothetical protein